MTAFSSPPKSFVTSLFMPFTVMFLPPLPARSYAVFFLSEHRRACKGGDGVLTGGVLESEFTSATAVRVGHDMGAGIGLEDDGIEIAAVPIGGLFSTREMA